jgi:hypothetical protein
MGGTPYRAISQAPATRRHGVLRDEHKMSKASACVVRRPRSRLYEIGRMAVARVPTPIGEVQRLSRGGGDLLDALHSLIGTVG